MTTHKAHATPTKDFFVKMITRDISLEDCILDLIDNCLDGARKVKLAAEPGAAVNDYTSFYAKVSFDVAHIEIIDNCGGISISEAIDYAFHFGRRSDAPSEGEYSIGLYGIGMKRAIFKMGNKIDIYSSTSTEAFNTKIDVKEWLIRPPVIVNDTYQREDWDFDMEDAAVNPATGTNIVVSQLHSEISAQFTNEEFRNGLARIIARDYAQFLAKGFEISINETKIIGYPFLIQESNEFIPIRYKYMDEAGVEVEIIAGMRAPPPDDLEPTERRKETDYDGWYVSCNDRIVIAADKSDQTVWGNNFPVWHYQYNGFMGVVSFHSKDSAALPWKTTKRDVDQSNLVYRRAVDKMKDATRAWINYTHERKINIPEAKRREASAKPIDLYSAKENQTFIVPKISLDPARIIYSSIQYSRPRTEIAKVKKLLGNSSMTNARAGEKTFEYFLANESED
jgi:hypothetical protein